MIYVKLNSNAERCNLRAFLNVLFFRLQIMPTMGSFILYSMISIILLTFKIACLLKYEVPHKFYLLLDYIQFMLFDCLLCRCIFQVKVAMWADGIKGEILVGVNARFGALLPPDANLDLRLPAIFSDPLNGCSNSSLKVFS